MRSHILLFLFLFLFLLFILLLLLATVKDRGPEQLNEE